jgi:long-chain acyl-CoA synthetase
MDLSTNRSMTIPQMLLRRVEAMPAGTALRQKEFGVWQPVSWTDYLTYAERCAFGFEALGVMPGDRVAILSENRKEWVFAQLGAAMMGAVPAGVYPTSPAHEIRHLLHLSGATVIVCEDQEQVDKVLSIMGELPTLRTLVVIDPRGLQSYRENRLTTFEALIALGEERRQTEPDRIRRRVAHQTLNDTALIIFTSGSTGPPKAAMIAWDGLLTSARGMDAALRLGPTDNIVSYLPLCHMAEQMFSVTLPILKGAAVNFAESLRTVQDDLREIAPQAFFGVPRIWEKFHAGIQIKIREAGGIRQRLYGRALASVGAFADRPRSSWSLGERAVWLVAYGLVLRSLLNTVGLRKCRVAVSAGAPISPEMLLFFRTLGVPIRELYGLTESSGAVTIQTETSPVGSVGPAIDGATVELAEDGEILVGGPVVFRGYFGAEEATREAIDEHGRLRTGDVGDWIDIPGGRELRIIDRKKDVMITAGGKNITPSQIENALRFSPYIKEAIAIGDRRHFVSALIQIDYDGVSKWAEEQNLAYTTFRSLVELPEVRELIQGEIDAVNERMPRVQHVRKFYLLTKELDHDDGEVTATMKVKRKSISKRYETAIEEMYAA